MQSKKLHVDDETLKLILNLLRQGTIKSKNRKLCLRRARKKVLVGTYKNGKPQYKLFWQCAKCKQWFSKETDLEVDHIEEVGPYKGDIVDFINRMYCEVDNLQTLCIVCHSKKTSNFNAKLKYERKNKNAEIF